MATDDRSTSITCCEWGNCDAVATVTVLYPARVPGYTPTVRCPVEGSDEMHCCEECAEFAQAEANAILRKHGEGHCQHCAEQMGDDDEEEV